MTGAPDFARMSRDEIANWLLEADDITPWREWAKPSRVSGTFVQVDQAGNPVERVVTVKMPSDMVAKLDSAAGRDRAGRSGVIRAAVEEYLERHRGDAA
ncbi:ribbon-helix-helix domain-containing protein [Dactylosporangium sp. CS-033363]|uniref:ribbon-helix-helix domain-containing protein n=1 Tax=Dactylosporangium sp. CS-033363 TaxID=3239935 RepID=UPI003D8BE197